LIRRKRTRESEKKGERKRAIMKNRNKVGSAAKF
jgi:hypothetical protein